jgi:ankyrin repeat protein
MRAEDVLKRYIDEDLPEFVELSLTDVNQRGNFGNTPLHLACTRGEMEEVEALLAASADVNAKGERGDTPLHDAVGQEHLAVVKRLLTAGASPDVVNGDGKTPRDIAVLMKRPAIVAAIDDWRKRKGT